ncbi:MAG: SAM-dependent methyltransferase [Gemmatimonadetes bacterium]|nr:SAM-dependent methyltransferase [Gemmatimonadota bacterium]
MSASPATTVEARARLSLGSSGDAIYRMVARLVAQRPTRGGVLVDVGCGGGRLWPFVQGHFTRCIGVDAVRYDALPGEVEFVQHDLDAPGVPIAAASADVVVAVETIEHLENPWSFTRELARLVRPGGLVIVTTPNQQSVLSLATLVTKGAFNAFQDSSWPAHRTALLPIDLRRVMGEAGLVELQFAHSLEGRMPLTGGHWPGVVSRVLPRACSDNVAIMGRAP